MRRAATSKVSVPTTPSRKSLPCKNVDPVSHFLVVREPAGTQIFYIKLPQCWQVIKIRKKTKKQNSVPAKYKMKGC